MEKNFGPLWFRYRQISMYYGHATRSHQSWIGWTEATTIHYIPKKISQFTALQVDEIKVMPV